MSRHRYDVATIRADYLRANLNRARINRTSWKVRCKGKPCRRQFAVGMLFHSMAQLRRSGRPYLTPPDVTFPRADFDFWQSGAAVNRLVEEDGNMDSDDAQ